jgi:hypothetical protein
LAAPGDQEQLTGSRVSEDGRLAVISREGASTRRTHIVRLDVSNPAEDGRLLSSFDDHLTGGGPTSRAAAPPPGHA